MPPIRRCFISTAPPKGAHWGRLTQLEKALIAPPWKAVREGVGVKLSPEDNEV